MLSAGAARAAPEVVRLQGRSLSFEWQAPPECPPATAVLERAEHLAGGAAPPASGSDAAVRARALQLQNGEWQLDFDSSGGSAPERRVLGDTCEEVADAAALLLALLVDPSVAARTPDAPVIRTAPAPTPPGSERASETSSNATPTPVRGDAPSDRDTRAIALHVADAGGSLGPSLEVALEGAILEGLLPHVALGARGAVGARFERLRLSVRVCYFPEQSDDAPGPGGSAELWFGSAGLLGAFRALRGPVELAPFLAVDLGRMHGRRSSEELPSGSVLLVGTGLGLMSEYRISKRFFVHTRVEGQILLTRPGFTAASELVHRPGWGALEMGLGALWVTDGAR